MQSLRRILPWSPTERTPSASTTQTLCGRRDPVGRHGSGSTGAPAATTTAARMVGCISRCPTTPSSATMLARRSAYESSQVAGSIGAPCVVLLAVMSAARNLRAVESTAELARKLHRPIGILGMNSRVLQCAGAFLISSWPFSAYSFRQD